ncbi:MAG: MFS transporter [Oscillatoriophycideae cyanobacterium NC_groundwater_1537_Pr4_S-0.65um_50_18]|nr:MFS transporter [Oscillatoriophycideae cyanobacterium NC_groundwater_1537_Pr4_S-0.65um_50_18]
MTASNSSENISTATAALTSAPPQLEEAPNSAIALTQFPSKLSKPSVRTSLQASTLDGVFAALFSNITTGVLVTNFLLELGASTFEIGVLTAIPMVANLVQPLGAHLSQKASSLYSYSLETNGIARLMWWMLAIGIGWSVWYRVDSDILIGLTLITALASALLAALSSASWLSWMVILVPRRLRGRYFSIRNSAAHLTNLISVPATGWIVSEWQGGSIEGFGIMLVLATIAGLLSLVCQNFMIDINPQIEANVKQEQTLTPKPTAIEVSTLEKYAMEASAIAPERSLLHTVVDRLSLQTNQIIFLVYISFWLFAVNIGTPFYNLYMLDVLHIDIAKVSIYNSFSAGANLLLLVGWGKLADRIGNRLILLGIGVVVAIIPLCWLGTDASVLSLWLWLPGLHLLIGGTWAAIDLCLINLQLSVAPVHNPASYFGTVAALSGVMSALGTLTGGFLAQSWHPNSVSGLLGVFVLSSGLRLLAILPLFWVKESDRVSTTV